MKAKVSLAAIVSLLFAGAQKPDAPNRVVVTVNGVPIVERQALEEIDVRINAQAAQDRGRGLVYDESSRDDTRAFLRDDVLHTMIERLLIAGQLKADHLEISDAEVAARFAKEAADRQQTLAQAEASIAEEGQTLQSVQEGLRQTMGVERLFKAHATDQKEMTEAEARQFYHDNPNYFAQPEQRRVSRILFRYASDADAATKADARKKAEGAMSRIKAGEDFGQVAQQCSEDEATQLHGGDRGWSARGWVTSPDADPFGNVAFGMKTVGEISGVVQTQDGCDIIKLTGLKAARLAPFEELEPQIVRDFRYRKIGDFWNGYGAALWKKATVEWSAEELARQAKKEKDERAFQEKMEAEAKAKQPPAP
jgi:parvulin-like peptidyl-prolyl isomerase